VHGLLKIRKIPSGVKVSIFDNIISVRESKFFINNSKLIFDALKISDSELNCGS